MPTIPKEAQSLAFDRFQALSISGMEKLILEAGQFIQPHEGKGGIISQEERKTLSISFYHGRD